MSTRAFATAPERILQSLDWHVVRRLDGLLQGDYRSLFHGHGLDFSDLREYQVEDDIRYIDWNVTARMDRPYVRQYYEDRAITAWFLLDLSPSMDFGSFSTLKRTMLIDLVGVLARLLTRHGNRVGALIHDGRAARAVPPGGGRMQVLRLIHEMLEQSTTGNGSLTDLADLFESGLRAIRGRSLIFAISDFITVPGWERPLRQLSRKHEVIGVRVLDNSEIEFPDVGAVVLRDSESGEQLYVDTHDSRFRRRFQELTAGRERELTRAFKASGVDLLTIMTQEDLVRTLLRFAAMRRQRRR
jgi:uncharacterized protein (DUF58 family)